MLIMLNHKIIEKECKKEKEIREEDRDIETVTELQLTKILNELKTIKLTHPDTPCLDESIALVEYDISKFKSTFIERKILANQNLYEYRINFKTKRIHFYKSRNNKEYISVRDYYPQ